MSTLVEREWLPIEARHLQTGWTLYAPFEDIDSETIDSLWTINAIVPISLKFSWYSMTSPEYMFGVCVALPHSAEVRVDLENLR